jgi:2-oxo-4-hydroxy-4-carboxy-5-ureidoimidazoline decarboxylase
MNDRISLASLNEAPPDRFCALLANVYEHTPWVAELAVTRRPFATVQALFAALSDAVRRADADKRLALVNGHPELGDKTARATHLTEESAGEQHSAGLDRLSDAEYDLFHALNRAYRARFDHPFIVCVKRHGKESILRQFAQRLENTPESELAQALIEIDRIAALRLDALVAGDGPLAVTGSLSTHVLDTHAGLPAAGLSLELRELFQSGEHRILACARTNADGRTDQPLIAGRPLPIARYELVFDVADYFTQRSVPLSDPPFLDRVPVAFAIAEPEGHYHVPLLVSPWNYATYRGS